MRTLPVHRGYPGHVPAPATRLQLVWDAIEAHLTHGAMAHDDAGTESLVEQALMPRQRRNDGLAIDALPESWDRDAMQTPARRQLTATERAFRATWCALGFAGGLVAGALLTVVGALGFLWWLGAQ